MEEATKFYEWLLKIKNIYLSDNERMSIAYGKIIANNKKDENNNKVITRVSS